MKTTLKYETALYDLANAMERGEEFDYEGWNALQAYFEEYEESCGIEMEADVIAICCEFTLYSDMDEFNDMYDGEADEDEIIIRLEDGSLIARNY